MNLNTSGIKKASYSVTRMMIASCKLQGFLDLLTVRFEVAYRKIDVWYILILFNCCMYDIMSS